MIQRGMLAIAMGVTQYLGFIVALPAVQVVAQAQGAGPTITTGDAFRVLAETQGVGGRPRVVGFIGDSLTKPVTTDNGSKTVTAEMDELGLSYVNWGASGRGTASWTSSPDLGAEKLGNSTLLAKALDDFQASGVTDVQIMLGTNDAKTSIATSAENYRKNMRDIITATLKTPNIERVIINYPPLVGEDALKVAWDQDSSHRLQQYMEVAADLANGTTVQLGDTSAPMYFVTHPNELTDGVHPSDKGQQALGELWAQAYKRDLPLD